MKKVLSMIAVALMVVGLVGCMDDPDGSKQTVEKHVSKNN
jgi:predicted small lipoprotein YifL